MAMLRYRGRIGVSKKSPCTVFVHAAEYSPAPRPKRKIAAIYWGDEARPSFRFSVEDDFGSILSHAGRPQRTKGYLGIDVCAIYAALCVGVEGGCKHLNLYIEEEHTANMLQRLLKKRDEIRKRQLDSSILTVGDLEPNRECWRAIIKLLIGNKININIKTDGSDEVGARLAAADGASAAADGNTPVLESVEMIRTAVLDHLWKMQKDFPPSPVESIGSIAGFLDPNDPRYKPTDEGLQYDASALAAFNATAGMDAHTPIRIPDDLSQILPLSQPSPPQPKRKHSPVTSSPIGNLSPTLSTDSSSSKRIASDRDNKMDLVSRALSRQARLDRSRNTSSSLPMTPQLPVGDRDRRRSSAGAALSTPGESPVVASTSGVAVDVDLTATQNTMISVSSTSSPASCATTLSFVFDASNQMGTCVICDKGATSQKIDCTSCARPSHIRCAFRLPETASMFINSETLAKAFHIRPQQFLCYLCLQRFDKSQDALDPNINYADLESIVGIISKKKRAQAQFNEERMSAFVFASLMDKIQHLHLEQKCEFDYGKIAQNIKTELKMPDMNVVVKKMADELEEKFKDQIQRMESTHVTTPGMNLGRHAGSLQSALDTFRESAAPDAGDVSAFEKFTRDLSELEKLNSEIRPALNHITTTEFVTKEQIRDFRALMLKVEQGLKDAKVVQSHGKEYTDRLLLNAKEATAKATREGRQKIEDNNRSWHKDLELIRSRSETQARDLGRVSADNDKLNETLMAKEARIVELMEEKRLLELRSLEEKRDLEIRCSTAEAENRTSRDLYDSLAMSVAQLSISGSSRADSTAASRTTSMSRSASVSDREHVTVEETRDPPATYRTLDGAQATMDDIIQGSAPTDDGGIEEPPSPSATVSNNSETSEVESPRGVMSSEDDQGIYRYRISSQGLRPFTVPSNLMGEPEPFKVLLILDVMSAQVHDHEFFCINDHVQRIEVIDWQQTYEYFVDNHRDHKFHCIIISVGFKEGTYPVIEGDRSLWKKFMMDSCTMARQMLTGESDRLVLVPAIGGLSDNQVELDRWSYVQEMIVSARDHPVIHVVENQSLRNEETGMVDRAALVVGRNHTFSRAGYRTFVSKIRACLSTLFPAIAKPVLMPTIGGPQAESQEREGTRAVTSPERQRRHSSPRRSPDRRDQRRNAGETGSSSDRGNDRGNYRRGSRRGHRGRGQRRRDRHDNESRRDRSWPRQNED